MFPGPLRRGTATCLSSSRSSLRTFSASYHLAEAFSHRAQTEEFEASQAQRYSPDEPNAETTRGTSPSSSPVNEGLAKQPSQQHTKEPQDQTPPIDESQSYIFRRISNQMRRSRTRTPGEMSEDDQHLQRNVRNMEVNREAQFVRFMERTRASRTIGQLVKEKDELRKKGASLKEISDVKTKLRIADIDYYYASYYPSSLNYLPLFSRREKGRMKIFEPRPKPQLWYAVKQCMQDGTLEQFRDGKITDPNLGETVIRRISYGGHATRHATPQKPDENKDYASVEKPSRIVVRRMHPSGGMDTPGIVRHVLTTERATKHTDRLSILQQKGKGSPYASAVGFGDAPSEGGSETAHSRHGSVSDTGSKKNTKTASHEHEDDTALYI